MSLLSNVSFLIQVNDLLKHLYFEQMNYINENDVKHSAMCSRRKVIFEFQPDEHSVRGIYKLSSTVCCIRSCDKDLNENVGYVKSCNYDLRH